MREKRREKQSSYFSLSRYSSLYLWEWIFLTHIRTHTQGHTHSSPILQCSPSQPGWQMQVPSWHWPCSSQRGWHALWSHAAPVQPSSHWHWPSEQAPWLPHGTGHSSVRQGEKKGQRKDIMSECWGKHWGFVLRVRKKSGKFQDIGSCWKANQNTHKD